MGPRYLISAILITLFVWGGLGLGMASVRLWGLIVPSVLLLWTFIRNKKSFELPRGFSLFLIFLSLLVANIFWSLNQKSTLEYLILLLGGGAWWLLLFNLGERVREDFANVIIVLGIVFGASYLLDLFLYSELPVRAWSLYLSSSAGRNHNHLGDLWAIVVVVLSHKLLTKPRWWHWALIVLGTFFLTISLSRSSYLALGVGIFYLFNKFQGVKKFRKLYFLLLAVATGLFLYAGLFKSTFFARPYFEQAIWGFKKWPFGVGVGNFGTISTNAQGPWWIGPRTGIFSSYAHNVVIEMISGMGFLGLVFAVWLIYVLVDALKNSKETLFTAVFLAITANFMFDTTYYIPTMLWLWFATLGLAGSKGQKDISNHS